MNAVIYTDDEIRILEQLRARSAAEGEEEGEAGDASSSSSALERTVLEALPTLPTDLILKLRKSTRHEDANIREIALRVESITKDQLSEAKATLEGLLDAGEIRKLDGLIGSASRAGKLNAPFFNVLLMNIKDASEQQQQQQQQQQQEQDPVVDTAATTATGNADAGGGSASRLQILEHIYTRCQEEVEKQVPPGHALLNKLLRTEQDSIRANLYRHYLTPSSGNNVITTPDGKQVELKSPGCDTDDSDDTNPEKKEPLVSLESFVSAIADTVRQIRTLERGGGMDRPSAASMVEMCRTVAKEARSVLVSAHGPESDQVVRFQDGLQPVFRPTTADSPYVPKQQ